MASRAKIRHLRSIVVPCLNSDLPKLPELLALWNKKEYWPLESGKRCDVALIFLFNNGDENHLESARLSIAGSGPITDCFESIEFLSADLSGDRDLYVKDSEVAEGKFGNKAGPNFLFQKAMHVSRKFGGHTLQIEIDCIPIVRGWINKVNRIIGKNSSAWVIGSPYLDASSLNRRIQFHINGNAIYKSGDANFIHFLDSVWMPRIKKFLQINPNLAYDCWWAFEMSRANGQTVNESWQIWQRYCFKFQYSPMVVNLTVPESQRSRFLDLKTDLESFGSQVIFFHGGGLKNTVSAVTRENISVSDALLQPSTYDEKLHIGEAGDSTKVKTPTLDLVRSNPTMSQRIRASRLRRPWNKLRLGKSFNNIEILDGQFLGIQGVWTKGSYFSLYAKELYRPLLLPFFRNAKIPKYTSGLPHFQVKQGNKYLPHELLTWGDDFCALRVGEQHINLELEIEIEGHFECALEDSTDSRTRGLLLLGMGLNFLQ